MLKKLWNAALVLLFVLLITGLSAFTRPAAGSPVWAATAVVSGGNLSFLRDTGFFKMHAFDSNGVCICLDELGEDQLVNAPKISINPAGQEYVSSYMEKNALMLDKILVNGRNNIKVIEQIFTRRGLPLELKYLAVVESRLKPTALSKVGAVGLWQLMPVTARGLGLSVNSKTDERKSPYKSTLAAAKYLERLYKTYEDWLLVIAAYNCGPGGVDKAIRRAGSRDFWKIQYFLPLETRLHVKKFVGTHYYYEGHGSLTTLTKEETKEHLSAVEAFYARYAGEKLAQMATQEGPDQEPVHRHSLRITAIVHDDDLLKLVTKK